MMPQHDALAQALQGRQLPEGEPLPMELMELLSPQTAQATSGEGSVLPPNSSRGPALPPNGSVMPPSPPPMAPGGSRGPSGPPMELPPSLPPATSFSGPPDSGAGPKALPEGWETAVEAGATSGSGRPTPSVVEPPQTGGVPPPFEAGLLGTPPAKHLPSGPQMAPGLPPSPPPFDSNLEGTPVSPHLAGGTAPSPIGGIPGSPPRQAGRLSSPTQGEEAWKTYERVTGDKWGGGASPEIVQLLQALGINAKPGSMEANIALQRALNKQEPAKTEAPPLSPEQWRALGGGSPQMS